MFEATDKKKFENYLQSVIERPLAIPNQIHVIKGGYVWCNDWRIIELLKYFINGEAMYAGDPPPNRLKNNPLWDKEYIVAEATHMLEAGMTADAIIDQFKKERSINANS